MIVPLSDTAYDLEQDFKVLKYLGKGEFDVVEEIMKTSFARRVDKKLQTD